jgi:hypothetical protein
VKYFSPHLLDGSVTTAKLATAAVTNQKIAAGQINRGKLASATSSQGGTIPSSSSVLVAMSPYTFFMDAEMVDGNTAELTPAGAATPAGDADAPQFNILNNISATKLYDVEWRHISA